MRADWGRTKESETVWPWYTACGALQATFAAAHWCHAEKHSKTGKGLPAVMGHSGHIMSLNYTPMYAAYNNVYQYNRWHLSTLFAIVQSYLWGCCGWDQQTKMRTSFIVMLPRFKNFQNFEVHKLAGMYLWMFHYNTSWYVAPCRTYGTYNDSNKIRVTSRAWITETTAYRRQPLHS